MTENSRHPGSAAPAALSDWSHVGQQILNLLDRVHTRAAERRALNALARRDLDDCDLTLADVRPSLPDLYAHDFRVARVSARRAA